MPFAAKVHALEAEVSRDQNLLILGDAQDGGIVPDADYDGMSF